MTAPPIVDRAGWAARPPSNRVIVDERDRTGFMVHYDGAEPLTQAHSGCAARVLADQRYHMGTHGWADIGYNFLVCQHGTVFVGRGWGIVGAHCTGYNTSSVGAQLMIGGNQAPSPAALSAMRWLYDEACRRAGRRLAQLGHRDGMSTVCPGDLAYSWVQAGMPAPSTGKETDMATVAELSALIETALDKRFGDVIPAPDPNDENPTWYAASYWRWTFLTARRAAADAAAALAIIRAQAEAGRPLTAAEVAEAAKTGAADALEDRITGATVTLEVTK